MTTIAFVLAMFPIALGCLAFLFGAILAALQVRASEAAPYTPEATAAEGAAWCEALIVDLEWLDMAQAAAEYAEAAEAYRAVALIAVRALAPRPVARMTVKATRASQIALSKAIREACRAAFAPKAPEVTPEAPAVHEAPEVHPDCMAWPEYSCGACHPQAIATRIAEQAIADAQARIVARVKHGAHPTPLATPTHATHPKLVSYTQPTTPTHEANAMHTDPTSTPEAMRNASAQLALAFPAPAPRKVAS